MELMGRCELGMSRLHDRYYAHKLVTQERIDGGGKTMSRESVLRRQIGWIKPTTLLLDLCGLVFISWFLFSVPEPVDFGPEQEHGFVYTLKGVEKAINTVSRNMDAIYKMRFGFGILIFSWCLKAFDWCRSYFLGTGSS